MVTREADHKALIISICIGKSGSLVGGRIAAKTGGTTLQKKQVKSPSRLCAATDGTRT